MVPVFLPYSRQGDGGCRSWGSRQRIRGCICPDRLLSSLLAGGRRPDRPSRAEQQRGTQGQHQHFLLRPLVSYGLPSSSCGGQGCGHPEVQHVSQHPRDSIAMPPWGGSPASWPPSPSMASLHPLWSCADLPTWQWLDESPQCSPGWRGWGDPQGCLK